MGIDSSIYAHFAQPVKSVQDYDNERMQGQQNQLALALQQQKADEYTRSIDDSNKLRGVVSGFTSDRNGNQQKLLQSGHLKEAEDYGKGTREADKANLEAKKAEIEGHMKKFELSGQIMAGVRDQATWDQARAQTAQLFGPDAAAQMPAVYDPQLVESKRQQAMPVKEQLAAEHQKLADALAERKFGYEQTNDAANRGVTVRGQNMTASTAAAGRAQADRHFNATQENGKTQVLQSDSGPLLVNTKTGSGRAITGPDGEVLAGVTKPLNDSQSKALLFGTRMQEADKVLNQLAAKGVSTSVPGSRAPGIGGIITAFSSDEQQQLDQAKRDFMTATLRRESGASISPGEFDTADKQYFPQVGDSPGVIAQKARNRQLALNGVLVEVPEKQRKSITPVSVTPTAKAAPSKTASGATVSNW